ncbi:MAG: RecX family transcriptional regulator [Dehalococcoidia bacterium]|nr:RecX family transcriptional regulator [Dehalococcoidia bacterium]
MRTITAVEVQRGNRERVNLHLDGCYAFSVDLAIALEANLSVGQPLADEDLAELTREDETRRCYDAALRFLGYRPRSSTEVRQRLRQRGWATVVVDVVVHRLEEKRLIDDTAFASLWLENRRTFKPSSERIIRLELRQKGIDAETIEEMVADLDETEAAYAAGKKKSRSLAGCDAGQFRQRLGAFLQRRGFDHEHVTTAVTRLWQERDLPGQM